MKAIKDSVIYLIGELIAKAMPFLLLPYLSRKLGVEGFGELSYYQTFIMLFFIAISLSQDGAVTRYFYFYGKRSINVIVSTGYVFSLVVGCLILCVCWLLQSQILIYITISTLFQSFLSVQLSIRQCQKQAIPYTVIQFMSGMFSVLLTVLFLEIFDQNLVEKRILALLFSNLIVFFIAYFGYSKRTTFKRYSIAKYQLALLYLFSFGLPLIFHNISFFLKGQLDRIFIFHQFTQAELGLYAMGAQIAAILMVLLQALNKALVPYFYEGLKQKSIDIKKVHKWALSSFLLVPLPFLVVWILPENWIIWVLGEQFIGTKYYILCFILSTTLVIPYFILVNYLFYQGENKLISICSILSTFIYVVLLLFFTTMKIEYIPFASIISAISIIPILFYMTKRVANQK